MQLDYHEYGKAPRIRWRGQLQPTEEVTKMPEKDGDDGGNISNAGHTRAPTRIKIYMVTGPMSFVAADLAERMRGWSTSHFEVLVLRLDGVGFIEMEDLIILDNLMVRMHASGLRMILCGANDSVKDRLFKAGLDQFEGYVSYSDDISRALVEGRRSSDKVKEHQLPDSGVAAGD